MSQLVLVHGRAQQDKDADDLKRGWIAALREGLDAAGLQLPIPESAIRFPYYGDTLRDLVKGSERAVTEIIIRGEGMDEGRRAFVRDVVAEVREQVGISDAEIAAEAGQAVVERGPQDWAWVRAVLRQLDQLPVASATTVALFTNDVYKYLNNVGIREKIDTGVRKALTPRVPTVVVGHSLGSVVAYNVLRRDGVEMRWQVPLLVTVGSPLGIHAVRAQLTAVEHPRCARRWFNAADPRDIVALHPLDGLHFPVTPAIENKADAVNTTDNRHGIGGYLSDPVVAKRVHDALIAD